MRLLLQRFQDLVKNTDKPTAAQLSLDGDLKGDLPSMRFDSASHRTLPIEIWLLVVSFACRMPESRLVSLPDPFISGMPKRDLQLRKKIFQKTACTVQLVCRTWRVVALPLLYENLTLCCSRHALKILKVLEESARRGALGIGRGYGALVYKIETRFNICEENTDAESDVEQFLVFNLDISRILMHTPELAIYNNYNDWQKPLRKGTRTHAEVVHALGFYCGRSLCRLEWGTRESPRWQDLQVLLTQTPNLRSLSLVHMGDFTDLPASERITRVSLPLLRELTLGLFPSPPKIQMRPWDKILAFFTPENIPYRSNKNTPLIHDDEDLPLPSLESLTINPLYIVKDTDTLGSFFSAYGPRIRHLRVADSCITYHEIAEPYPLNTLLSMCPNLKSLIFNPSSPHSLAMGHATLEKVALFPPQEAPIRYPVKLFEMLVKHEVENFLTDVLSGSYPALKSIRIRDTGTFFYFCRTVDWIKPWYLQLLEKGIRIENREGLDLGYLVLESMESMPDTA